MGGFRVIRMEFGHAVGHRVGERVFLRIQGAVGDATDGLGQVDAAGLRAEQFERPGMYRAGQNADFHSGHVPGHPDGAKPVGDMPETRSRNSP